MAGCGANMEADERLKGALSGGGSEGLTQHIQDQLLYPLLSGLRGVVDHTVVHPGVRPPRVVQEDVCLPGDAW